MKNKLIEFYLDWVNNFLTIPVMAEHYNITEEHCKQLIKIGGEVHEANVEFLRFMAGQR